MEKVIQLSPNSLNCFTQVCLSKHAKIQNKQKIKITLKRHEWPREIYFYDYKEDMQIVK